MLCLFKYTDIFVMYFIFLIYPIIYNFICAIKINNTFYNQNNFYIVLFSNISLNPLSRNVLCPKLSLADIDINFKHLFFFNNNFIDYLI